jgi:iron complex transport system ATP-binding protein
MSPLLQTRQLQVDIAGKTICQALDLNIARGQCWGILGSNGAGKTTLLHTLAGLRPVASGTVLLDGNSLVTLTRRAIAQRIGVLFQDAHDAFPDTVLNTVLIGRHPHLKAWGFESAEDIALARSALAATGLGGLEQRLISTLSGGERRRVALATVLAQDPALYLLDEPVNHLDLHQQIAALELLGARVREDGKTVMMSVHDVNLAARYCDHVLLLFGDGTLIQGPTGTVLNRTSLERLYRHPVVSVAGPRGPAFLPG